MPRTRGVGPAILRNVRAATLRALSERRVRGADGSESTRGEKTWSERTGGQRTGSHEAGARGAGAREETQVDESEGAANGGAGSERGREERARSGGARSGRHALGRWVRLPVDFEEAKDRAVRAFGAAGFAPLTTIDVAGTLAAKLGAEMERFEVLGMCNAGFARSALEIDRTVGLLLPCNVVVREDRMQPGVTLVEVLDPGVLFEVIDSDVVAELALQLTSAVTTAMAHLAETADAPADAQASFRSGGGSR